MPALKSSLALIAFALLALAPLAGETGDVEAGKAVFVDQKCGRCHAVESLGIEATIGESMRGPALDSSPARDAEWLKAYIAREETLDDKKHRAPWRGSDEELDQLVAFLMSLYGD